MFFRAIVEGLYLLRHWEIWTAAILFAVVNYGFLFIAATVDSDSSATRSGLALVLVTVGWPALYGVLISVMIFTLMPILMGGYSIRAVSELSSFFWPIVETGIKAIVIVVVLQFIPLIGGFISDSPATQFFIMGVIIFISWVQEPNELILAVTNVCGSVVPGFWASGAFMIISVVLVFLGIIGETLFAEYLEKRGKAGDVIALITGPMLVLMGGIIPLLMYTSYVRLSLNRLFAM